MGQDELLEWEMAPHFSIPIFHLPGKLHGQSSLAGYGLRGGRKLGTPQHVYVELNDFAAHLKLTPHYKSAIF